jgi:hypothetical protein
MLSENSRQTPSWLTEIQQLCERRAALAGRPAGRAVFLGQLPSRKTNW